MQHGVASAELVFENVSFAHSPDKPLITDLSLAAEPGQTVAIVGPTGAGKMTLVNLMMRFYELDAGRIMLDGVDPRRAALADGHGAAGHLTVRRVHPGQHRPRRRRDSRGPTVGPGAGV